MRLWQFPGSIAGQWISALTILSLIISPFGCQTFQLFLGGLGDPDNPFGVLVNSDTGSDVLGGVRVESGESVFAFGTFGQDGGIGEIQDVVFTNAQGEQASLSFESGRPKKGVSFDGSSVEVTYEEVSLQRLKGTASLFIAGTGETHAFAFDVDLQMAVAELARVVADLTGQQVSQEEPPDNPTAKAQPAAVGPGGTAKPVLDRQALNIAPYLFSPSFALSGFFIVLVMTQIMQAAIYALAVTAVILVRAMIIAVFLPFILMGELLRSALGRPVMLVDFGLLGPAVVVPHRPGF